MSKNPFNSSLQQRRVQAAIRYSRADKSDPHAFNRAMCHINNGIVDRVIKDKGPPPCIYDADTYPATLKLDERWLPLLALRPNMTEVPGTAYRNVCRP